MLRDEQPDFTVLWDGEAKVWIAMGDYIKGFVLEAATLEELGRRCDECIPDLMAANGQELRPVIASVQSAPEIAGQHKAPRTAPACGMGPPNEYSTPGRRGGG